MDPNRAKELLARERDEVERQLATIGSEGPEEGDERREPGDQDSEGLYQDEFDAGRAEDPEAEAAGGREG